MKHTKEPWTEDMFGTQPFSNYKQVPKEDFERAMICVNACAGITNEALEKGIVLDSVKLHEAILEQQPSSFFKEYGVKVWEDV